MQKKKPTMLKKKVNRPVIPCEWCGEKTNYRGNEYYAHPPHRRPRVTCTKCGHTYVINRDKDKVETVEGESENGNTTQAPLQ